MLDTLLALLTIGAIALAAIATMRLERMRARSEERNRAMEVVRKQEEETRENEKVYIDGLDRIELLEHLNQLREKGERSN